MPVVVTCVVFELLLFHTVTCRGVVLREAGAADTLKGADSVSAVRIVATRVVDCALIDVFVTVRTLEAYRTLGTTCCHVALCIAVTTVAVMKTVLAPRATGTRCNVRQLLHLTTVQYNTRDGPLQNEGA